MTTYNTGNPIGSFDTRDRADNTQNLDLLVNGTVQSYPDRLGVSRKSWKGFEADFAAFLAASGFELPALDYVDGTPLVVARPTQLIDRDGILYSVKPSESFPATLTGTWATDQTRVVVRTDQDLRQDLAENGGSALVGYGDSTVEGALDELYSGAFGVSNIIAESGENITAKIESAISSGAKVINLPVGTFLFNNPLTIDPGFRGLIIRGQGMQNTILKATVTGQPSVLLPYNSASFYPELYDFTIDGDSKATEFRNESAYTFFSRIRSYGHVARNYHAAGLINYHLNCVFPPNPSAVLCSGETVWVSHNANYFAGCYIHGGGPTGFALRINDDNGKESVKNSFVNCTIENGKVSIEDGAYSVSFDDSYFEQIEITASGNCNGLYICNNRGAEEQPFIHLNNVSRLSAVKISDNNISFDIYVTVANREGAVDDVLDFYQFPELVIEPNGRRQQPILINGLVACDMLKVQRSKIPGDVSGARVEIIGLYAEMPALATPTPVKVLSLYLRAAALALDGYFIEEKSYARRPAVGSGGVEPYRASYWLASGWAEYPSTSGGTTGATARTAIFERNPAALSITYAIAANGANSKKWEMYSTGEANRLQYISTDLKLTQIS